MWACKLVASCWNFVVVQKVPKLNFEILHFREGKWRYSVAANNALARTVILCVHYNNYTNSQFPAEKYFCYKFGSSTAFTLIAVGGR